MLDSVESVESVRETRESGYSVMVLQGRLVRVLRGSLHPKPNSSEQPLLSLLYPIHSRVCVCVCVCVCACVCVCV